MLAEPTSGNYGVELSTTTSKFDNLNTVKSSGVSNQYLMMVGVG